MWITTTFLFRFEILILIFLMFLIKHLRTSIYFKLYFKTSYSLNISADVPNWVDLSRFRQKCCWWDGGTTSRGQQRCRWVTHEDNSGLYELNWFSFIRKALGDACFSAWACLSPRIWFRLGSHMCSHWLWRGVRFPPHPVINLILGIFLVDQLQAHWQNRTAFKFRLLSFLNVV